VDAEPLLRTGDISASGIYYETDVSAGANGTVQWLYMVSEDKRQHIELMTHVVRTVVFTGASHAFGVALEFRPESDERVDALRHFVAYVLAQRLSREPPASDPVVRAAERLHSRPAGTLSVDLPWLVPSGASLRLELSSPEHPSPVRLRGNAVRVEPITNQQGRRYRVELAVLQDQDGPLRRLSSTSMQAVRPESQPEASGLHARGAGEDIARSVDELVSSALGHPQEPMPPRQVHLSGALAPKRLALLGALLDMEGISGELAVTNGVARATLFVKGGRVVDVSPVPDGVTPRVALARVLGWSEGAFEFVIRDVDCPDRVGSSLGAIALELA
jgi:hypothetical protein